MSTVATDDEVRANLAANVVRLLEIRGWTQQDLAEATGENKMTISRVCRGQNVAGAGVVSRIAEALDVSADRLLSLPPPVAPQKIGSRS